MMGPLRRLCKGLLNLTELHHSPLLLISILTTTTLTLLSIHNIVHRPVTLEASKTQINLSTFRVLHLG